MNDSRTKAQALVERAQAALDAALLIGANTAQAREDLEAAKANVSRPEALPGHRPEDEIEAQALIGETALALLADLRRIDPHAEMAASLPLTVAIELRKAERLTAEHAALIAEHRARLAAVNVRRSDLGTQRAAIIERRAMGHLEPDDGATLALLDADIEGMGDLIHRAEAQCPTPDQSRADEWRGMWDRAVQEERQRLLGLLATEQGRRLADALLALRDAQGATVPNWRGWAELDRIRLGQAPR